MRFIPTVMCMKGFDECVGLQFTTDFKPIENSLECGGCGGTLFVIDYTDVKSKNLVTNAGYNCSCYVEIYYGSDLDILL